MMQIPAGYITPFLDSDYMPAQDKYELIKYRRYATEWGLPKTFPILYSVYDGYSPLVNTWQAGGCVDNFAHLRKTPLLLKPTPRCFAFCIPLIVPGSEAKTSKEQLRLLAGMRDELNLPEHHLSGFGEASLIACILRYYWEKAGDQERCRLLKYCCVRTDSHVAEGGHRLCLGENNGTGFQLFSSILDEQRDPRVGVFAIGIEELPVKVPKRR